MPSPRPDPRDRPVVNPIGTVIGLALLAASGLAAILGIGDLDGRFVIPGRSVTGMPYSITLPLLGCIVAIVQIVLAPRRELRVLWVVAVAAWLACAVAFLFLR